MRILALLVLAASVAAGDKPRLVVIVSVDQMRPDTLTRFDAEYTGGLKRVLERGARFRGFHDHAATETGPGHAVMTTGCHPGTAGIVANNWLDPRTLEGVYCVAGDAPDNLLRDGLGDWMKRADPKAKVFSVAGKDRAAILMGGKGPDGVYWFDRKGEGFTARGGAPEWLTAFNRDGWIDAVPEHWTYEPVPWLRADDYEGEAPRFGRAAPHPLRAGTLRETLERLYGTPWLDEWTLRLARATVERFDLGGDESCDLLCLSLSACDTAGHLYGPRSQEIRDLVLRLDRHLGAFFEFLDARGAAWTAVLTADHGVLPIPEALRVDARRLLQDVESAVAAKVGHGALVRVASGDLYLDRARLAELKLEPDAVLAALRGVLEARPEVEAVFDRAQMMGGAGGELAGLVRRAWV